MGSKRKRGAKGNSNDNQPSRKKAKNGEVLAVPATKNLDLDKSPFSEKPIGEDRKREAEVYELLGSYDSAEHIAAADALVTGLLNSQEVVLERHLEKRLFRGLASSRNASRVGFSLVLTELLGQLYGPKNLAGTKFPGLTFDKVLETLLEKTEPGANVPGQEERDFYFGQLFGLQSFVEAKILFNDDGSRWPTILDLVLKLADKKVWLRSQCAWLIVGTLPQMGQEKAGETLKQLVDIGLGKTAEGVGIWIKATSCYPDIKLPNKPWTHPLAPKSIPELANILKDNVKQDAGNQDAAAQSFTPGNWTAQLHFVWDFILAHFMVQISADEAQNLDQFKIFWNTVVDDGLFSKNATESQKFRGFMIFQKFLQAFTVEKDKHVIKELFSRNLMKCLINQAAKEDRYVHRAAIKSLKTIVATVEAVPTLLLPILKVLLGKHGVYDFDQRTSSKAIERLLQYSNQDTIKAVFKILREPVAAVKGDDITEIENMRRVYADYVFKLCTQDKSPAGGTGDSNTDSNGILELALGVLGNCAYTTDDSFTPALSEKTQEYCRGRLESVFAKLTKRREDYRYLCDAVLSINPTAVQMSADIEAERKAALKALRRLVKASGKSNKGDTGSTLGLALLYAITILQLYNGDSDALGTLEDLKQCSEKLKEGDAAASALLVEILLSLVSRPSPMMRQITQQVFEAFTAQLSADAVVRLTDPLEAEENIKGQQALFEAEDEEMVDIDGADESEDEDENEEEDEDEISEIGSDVEFVTLNGADVTAGEDDDEDDGSDDADENDDGAQELADLDDALAQVLKSHRLDKDIDAESSDDDADMTDSEMMALDEKLVEVFKQRSKTSNKKKEGKDAKEMIIIFKHRVLDFLDIYVKKEARNPLAFNLLLPLVQLVQTTQTKDLANKAMKVISDFSEAFKKEKANVDKSTISVETQMDLLREIHQKASQDPSHAFARALSAASLLVASSLFAAKKDSIQQVALVYASTQADWAMGKIKVQPVLFSEWLNWCQAHASTAKV